LANIRSWWQRCHAVKADGMLVTSWEAYRLALETTTVVDAAAANLWLEPEHDDATTMLTRGMERVFGHKCARIQARALLAADDHAFSGYARWQISNRWDVFAGNESHKPYLADLKFYERLQTAAYGWPPAFSASLDFRLYLAKRDIFVRQTARNVFKLRKFLAKSGETTVRLEAGRMHIEAKEFARALKAGQKAARAMWRRTREPRARGQNDRLLSADAERLSGWQTWLKRLAKAPRIVMEATPVCGVWQLQFVVHNFAPAVQKVIVEEMGLDGSWRETVSRHTVEFRAQAARPRTMLKREFTAPIESLTQKLRLRVTGTGQVALSHLALTNGVEILHPQLRRQSRKLILGTPAPKQGLPEAPLVDDSRQILLLDFAPSVKR
jgi:hypothetical protein